MTEAQRVSLNEQRLLKISPTIRDQVARCLATLEAYDHSPVIGSEVWRKPSEQLRLYRLGRTKVKWGFHCATTPDGKPDSLAADIVCADLGWNASREFWVTLGYAAYHNNLSWGGLWLPTQQMKEATQAYVIQKAEIMKQNVPGRVKLGWDVAHVETKRVTVSQAYRGLR